MFFLKAKKEVITTIAAKKYLPIDPKSNEMTKNGSKPYLWHRFLVLMGYLSVVLKFMGFVYEVF